MARKKKSANESTVQTLSDTTKKKYVGLAGLKESNNKLLEKIIESPIVDNVDYLIGVKDGELCRYKEKTVSYRFVGSDVGDSVVVIDDEPITVSTNETIKGKCYDITEITTNNLEEIHIWGDVSLTIGNGSKYNDTVKVVEMQFSNDFSRSFYQLCGYLRVLTDATITGGKPTSCQQMFKNCESLVNVNVSGQDFSECETMDSMFSGCESLPTVDVSDWDVSKVLYFGSMFSQCLSLTNLDVSKWNLESGERFGSMFQGDSLLTELDVSGWGMANADRIHSMFYGCSGLTKLDVSKWSTSKITRMDDTFYGCSSLTSLDVSKWDVSSCTTLEQTFTNCSSLTTLDVSGWNTSKVTTLHDTFYGCSSLTSLDVSKWDVSSCTTLLSTFYGCSSLTSLDVSGWNTSKVTTLYNTFYDCSSLTTLDVSGWNTSKVTTLHDTFYGCSSLTSLDVSGWDVSSCTTLEYTFCGCSSLITFDGSSWDVSRCSSFTRFFCDCGKLESVVFGDDWDLYNAIDEGGTYGSLAYMFRLCSSLMYVSGTLKNIMITVGDLDHCPLTRESALVFINGLYDYASTGEEGKTLKLSSTTKELLTDDDIAIATNKGWTIA